jgi:hypothetical protein
MNAFHRTEINDHAVIAQAKARHVMTGTQNRGLNVVTACDLYARDHVGYSGTTSHDCGMPVDHCIVDLARFVIARLAGTEHLAAQRRFETLN